MSPRFDLRCCETPGRWRVIDLDDDEVLLLNGIPQIDLSFEEADQLVELLNAGGDSLPSDSRLLT